MKLVLDFFLIGGIIITLLILFLLKKTKNRELSQNLLIVFFITLLLVCVNAYAELNEIPILYVLSFTIDDISVWLIGPLLLLYIKSLFLENKELIKRNKYHFTPVIFYFIFISIPILISILIDKTIFNYLKPLLGYGGSFFVNIRDTYLIIYLIFSLRLFSKYRKAMKSNYSNLTNSNFGWIRHLLIGSLIIISIDLTTGIYEQISRDLSWNTGYITVIFMIIFIVYLGYYGVNQSKILLPDFLINNDVSIKNQKEKSNNLSNVNTTELQELKVKLEKVLLEKKPYLDEDLTLSKLAQFVDVSDKKLSTFLNQYLNTTFYDLINKHRIEVVKEKLKSDKFENITLLGIAYESGFKSKTSFNRIFKKETGFSPSEYKKIC